MSESLALAYFVWTRHRLALSLIAAYWLALIVQCRMLPDEPGAAALWLVVFSSPCIFAFAYLLVIFSFGRDARLELRESSFPSRLRHLPLPTSALVGWPMLWGSAVLALAWLLLAWGAFRPALRSLGIEPPLWWPALMLAVMLGWLQAIIWTPFPLPWLRLIVLIPLLSPLAVLDALAQANGFSAAISCGLFIALLLAAYGVAVVGVARARRGDGPYWTWPGWSAWLRWSSSTQARPRFASPRQAQAWFEWRRVGLGFPVMMFAGTVIWLPLIPTTAAFLDDAHRARVDLVPPVILNEVGSLWLVALSPLIFAPFWASVCGWEMGKLSGAKRDLILSSFFATRPVSTWTFIRAKFEAAALSTLAGCSVAAAAILLWMALGGHAVEMAESFAALRQRHPGYLLWIVLPLLFGGAFVLTWLQIIQGLWIGLAGRVWTTAIATLGFTAFLGLVCLAQWLVEHPQHWQRLFDFLPWLTSATIVIKSLLAFRVSRILVRRGLVAPNIVRGILAVWVLSAAGLFSLLYWLLASYQVSVFAVVLGIVLVLPLTRLLLAPLALGWNRHQ